MDALEIVKTVIECAVAVHDAVQQVKSFKSRSRNLAQRVKIVTEPVEELAKKVTLADGSCKYKYKLATKESVREAEELMRLESPVDGESRDDKPLSYIRPLIELSVCIEEIKGFLEKLSTMDKFQRFFDRGNISSDFEGYDNQLTNLQQSLLLSLQVVFNEDLNVHFRNLKFDLVTMKKDNEEALAQDLGDLKDLMEQTKTKVDKNNEMLEALTDHLSDLQKQNSKQWNSEAGIGYGEFSNFKKIEDGTFGPICKANHNKEPKLLVIKKYTDSSHPSVKVLKDQLEVWRKLARSQFVVQPYGYTMDEDGHFCFVLENMHFGTLRKVLTDKEKHSLPWDRRLSLARDCAQGLYAIHYGVAGKTMLHRALTSTRFLVNKHYEAKIADNGFVTTQTTVSKSKTRTKGSLEEDEVKYHVPEDTESQFKATLKSEIYKLGVIFYEVASRKEPFESMLKPDGKGLADVYDFIKKGKTEEPPADTPAAFKELMDKCRATKPCDRPSTADVVSSFDKILQEV